MADKSNTIEVKDSDLGLEKDADPNIEIWGVRVFDYEGADPMSVEARGELPF